MTKLDELLSPKRQRIDDENVAAILTYDVVHDGQARIRAALVRQTLQEAAKLVCPHCANGILLLIATKGTLAEGRYYHNSTDVIAACDAAPIHARLAETEAK